MSTNLANLVQAARSKGYATASTWRADRHNDTGDIAISHYSTYMVTVHGDNTVTAVSRGWGSMSDKQGIRKVLANVSGQSYREVFGS